MRTVTTTLYQFDELSEEAKEKAIEQYRDKRIYDGDFFSFFTDDCLKSIKKGLKALGAELGRYSIDCLNVNQSSWSVDCENPGEDQDEPITGYRLRKWILNNHYSALFERKPYGEYTKNEKTGHWSYPRRSRIMYQETCCPFTGVCYDESFIDPIREFIKKPDSRNWEELLTDCVERALRDLESECEYYTTDEGVMAEINTQEPEFEEDGTLV